jgi:hypothetical protein
LSYINIEKKPAQIGAGLSSTLLTVGMIIIQPGLDCIAPCAGSFDSCVIPDK